jgi:hypothetical protein
MGLYWVDQYSLLHFAVGILAYFWNVPFLWTIIIHTLFEFLENTKTGMRIINSFPLWPGGKTHADNFKNRVSDTIFTGIGWILSKELDLYYNKNT